MLVVLPCWLFLITLQVIIVFCLKEKKDPTNSEIKQNPSPPKENSCSLASQSQSSQRPVLETNRSSKKIKKPSDATKPRKNSTVRSNQKTEPSSHASTLSKSIDINQEKTPTEPSLRSQWEENSLVEQVSDGEIMKTAQAELPMDDGYENYGPGDGTVEKETEYEMEESGEVRTATIYSKEKIRGGSNDAPSKDERKKKKLMVRKMKTISQTKRRKRPTKDGKSNRRVRKMPSMNVVKKQ